MRGILVQGNRESCDLPVQATGRTGKVWSHKPVMNGSQQPDRPVVPKNGRNAALETVAGDDREGRGLAKENPVQPDTHHTPRRESVTQGLERVRQAAQWNKKERFTALLHHVTEERLMTAYRNLNRRAAAGHDGVTWADFGQEAEARIKDLHTRIHRGSYRPEPSRRVYIPKPDGRQRPLGVAGTVDKIAPQALVEVLNAIYEEDFLDFSYGFRPGRSAHQALDALIVGIEQQGVNWVLESYRNPGGACGPRRLCGRVPVVRGAWLDRGELARWRAGGGLGSGGTSGRSSGRGAGGDRGLAWSGRG